MISIKEMTQKFLGVFTYSRQAIILVWQTSPRFTLYLALLTLISGLLPAGIAYFGQLIVDGVLAASKTYTTTFSNGFLLSTIPKELTLFFCLEAIFVIGLMMSQRGISILQSLFRGLLGHRVNWLILQKAQTLSLAQFEDSEFYDKLIRARREASTRPLGLANKTFGLLQNGIALASFAVLLSQFSPWIILILLMAAIPGIVSLAFA